MSRDAIGQNPRCAIAFNPHTTPSTVISENLPRSKRRSAGYSVFILSPSGQVKAWVVEEINRQVEVHFQQVVSTGQVVKAMILNGLG